MVAQVLTDRDFEQLGAYRDAGDRTGYYNYLADRGFDYGVLAGGVARDDFWTGGDAANDFLRQSYMAANGGKPLPPDVEYTVGLALMDADLAARREFSRDFPGQPQRLDNSVIQNYHGAVFKDLLGLDEDAWTATALLDVAEKLGGDAARDEIWQQMLSDDTFWGNVVRMGSAASITGEVLLDALLDTLGLDPAELSLEMQDDMVSWLSKLVQSVGRDFDAESIIKHMARDAMHYPGGIISDDDLRNIMDLAIDAGLNITVDDIYRAARGGSLLDAGDVTNRQTLRDLGVDYSDGIDDDEWQSINDYNSDHNIDPDEGISYDDPNHPDNYGNSSSHSPAATTNNDPSTSTDTNASAPDDQTSGSSAGSGSPSNDSSDSDSSSSSSRSATSSDVSISMNRGVTVTSSPEADVYYYEDRLTVVDDKYGTHDLETADDLDKLSNTAMSGLEKGLNAVSGTGESGADEMLSAVNQRHAEREEKERERAAEEAREAKRLQQEIERQVEEERQRQIEVERRKAEANERRQEAASEMEM
ncbi:hypothetical protein OAS86_07130 [Gammaproteobacteria bacterium]|nr:hypothetical protein [Gammaproteobacteria bacterium]